MVLSRACSSVVVNLVVDITVVLVWVYTLAMVTAILHRHLPSKTTFLPLDPTTVVITLLAIQSIQIIHGS